MRVRNIELTFGADPRGTSYLRPKRFGLDVQAGEALLHVGRFSWLLTW